MFRLWFIIGCLSVVTACSTDSEKRRAEYLDADYLLRLELPPDLILEDDSSQLQLPKPTEKAMREYKAGIADYGKVRDKNQDKNQDANQE